MATSISNLLQKVGIGGSNRQGVGTAAPGSPAAKPKRVDRTSTGTTPEKEARTWISDKWAKVRTSYLTYHQLIWQSILFYVGQTWLTWDPYRKFYYPSVPEDEFTPQPRINEFSPAVDAVATNFNSIPPVEAIAVDADGDEQYKRHGIALVASRLAKDFLKRQGLKSDFKSKGNKPTQAAMIFVLSGGLCTGLRVRQKQRDTPLGPLTEYEVEMDLLNPMVVLPRPGSEDFGGESGTPWVFVARRMTLNEVWTRFEVVAKADVLYLDGYNSTYENALNYYYTGFNATDIQNEDSCLAVELYVPPSKDGHPGVEDFEPSGLYAVWINDELKWYKDWDYPEFPLTMFKYISVPQLFFGRSISFDLCNLQEEYQAYEAIIKLHAMCNAISPWVVDANTLVGEITGRADKVVKYRSLGPGSVPPHREQPGSLDQGVYAQRQSIQSQFQNISGAASVFRGRQEGAVTAGSAIAQLRGQAEQMFSGPQLNWTNGWKETVRKAVKFMQKYYSFEQIQDIVGGTNNEQAIRDFKECPDLDAAIEWLASQRGLPRTQDELKQEFLNLFDRGALDMQQVEVRERVYDLFGETGMLAQFNLDATRARQENRGMKQTPPIAPTFMPEIEDLNVHYQVHIEEIKALEFDKLDPASKQIMIQHALATKQAMDMMAAQQAPPPGQPPQGGPPPPAGTGHLASHGKPTGGTQVHGQGIQPVGSSHGAPPAPPSPGQMRP
jgi:hypothetical protein